jgi:hypothetical protein
MTDMTQNDDNIIDDEEENNMEIVDLTSKYDPVISKNNISALEEALPDLINKSSLVTNQKEDILDKYLFDLLSSLYECKNCTNKNKNDQRCCIGSELNRILSTFPSEICKLTGEFLSIINSDFFNSPIPVWMNDLVQCYVKKEKNVYSVYLSIKDQESIQRIREKHLTQVSLMEKAKLAGLVDEKCTTEIWPIMTQKWGLYAKQCALDLILNNEDVLLMTATGTSTWKTTTYIITSCNDEHLCKLKSNFLGTEYIQNISKDISKIEDGLSIYYKHYDKSGGPRNIEVFVNKVNENETVENSNGLISKLIEKAGSVLPILSPEKIYNNLKPAWNENIQAHVLHFHNNRVKEKSVKNFKLTSSDISEGKEHQKTIMQFGRLKDRKLFILDFRYPITPIQAITIALSSIDCRL